MCIVFLFCYWCVCVCVCARACVSFGLTSLTVTLGRCLVVALRPHNSRVLRAATLMQKTRVHYFLVTHHSDTGPTSPCFNLLLLRMFLILLGLEMLVSTDPSINHVSCLTVNCAQLQSIITNKSVT